MTQGVLVDGDGFTIGQNGPGVSIACLLHAGGYHGVRCFPDDFFVDTVTCKSVPAVPTHGRGHGQVFKFLRSDGKG